MPGATAFHVTYPQWPNRTPQKEPSFRRIGNIIHKLAITVYEARTPWVTGGAVQRWRPDHGAPPTSAMMGLLKRLFEKRDERGEPAEEAVLVYLKLRDETFGGSGERERYLALEVEMDRA